MAEFIVRVKRVQVSYADIMIDAEDASGAAQAIDKLTAAETEGEADWLGKGPGDWEVESVRVSVEEIEDEDGCSFGDVDAQHHAALELED